MPSERRRRWAAGAALLALGVVAGCLLPPEIDAPPLDETLGPVGSSGGGGAKLPPCDASAPYGGNLSLGLGDPPPDEALRDQCVVNGNVDVDLASPHLARLAAIRTINGRLTVSGSGARGVAPLPALTSVRDLRTNGNMPVFPAFPALTTAKKVQIFNILDETLGGLDALTGAETLEIVGGQIQQIKTFGKLAKVGTGVRIEHLPALQAVTLPALTDAGWVRLRSLDSATAIALPKLSETNDLKVEQCAALTSLKIPALQIITTLHLTNLPNLGAPSATKITGLHGLQLWQLPKLSAISWIPAGATVNSYARVCDVQPDLAAKVTAWLQASGSKAMLSSDCH